MEVCCDRGLRGRSPQPFLAPYDNIFGCKSVQSGGATSIFEHYPQQFHGPSGRESLVRLGHEHLRISSWLGERHLYIFFTHTTKPLCPDHTKVSVWFQLWNCWRLCWEIDVGPSLFTLIQPKMFADGARSGWCDYPLIWLRVREIKVEVNRQCWVLVFALHTTRSNVYGLTLCFSFLCLTQFSQYMKHTISARWWLANPNTTRIM